MKTQRIDVVQEDGIIGVTRNDEVEYRYDCNYVIRLIKEDKIDAVNLANQIAEIIYGCLNCKSASATLKDLNDRQQYNSDGTYFERIDHLNR